MLPICKKGSYSRVFEMEGTTSFWEINTGHTSYHTEYFCSQKRSKERCRFHNFDEPTKHVISRKIIYSYNHGSYNLAGLLPGDVCSLAGLDSPIKKSLLVWKHWPNDGEGRRPFWTYTVLQYPKDCRMFTKKKMERTGSPHATRQNSWLSESANTPLAFRLIALPTYTVANLPQR